MEQSFDIKAIVFDLGRVLVGVDLRRGLFSYLPQKEKIDDVALLEELFSEELFLDFSTGKITAQEFHSGMCAKLGLNLPYEAFVREWCDIFYEMPGMDALFFEVFEKYPVTILSDIDSLHWAKVCEMFPYLKKVSNPVLSFKEGIMKPHPDIYLKAADSLNMPPQNCLFIDDRSINVTGAKKAGMQAVRYYSAIHLKDHLKNRNIL